MRVLLISTNRERRPQAVVPYGVCRVAAATAGAGHQVRILDLCFARHPDRAIREAIRRWMPDMIGLSIRNLDNGDAAAPRSYLPGIRQRVQSCRQYSRAPIALGGAAVSLAPRPLLLYCLADYAVVGDGDVAFPRLLAALDRGEAPPPPCVWSADPSCSDTPQPAQPAPGLLRQLPLCAYHRHDAAFPVQTKQGCAFRCTYCSYPTIEGASWRLRDASAVAEEAMMAKTLGFRAIEFVDSVFGLPAAHALAVCETFARRGVGLPCYTTDLHPVACTPVLAGALTAAGFSAVGITAESGSDRMLMRLGKGFTVSDLHRAREAMQRFTGTRLWIFLLGGAGENASTLQETARFIGTLPPSDLVFITLGIRVLPGTPLHTARVRAGHVAQDDPLLQPHFALSPEINPALVRRLLTDSGFPPANLVFSFDAGHPWLPAAQWVMRRVGCPPPYWRYLPFLNRIRQLLKR